MSSLKSPYVYFGGKSKVVSLVWERLGDPKNFVEPFFGSGAVTLARPSYPFTSTRIETINDADGMVSNFWRAIKADPEAVAEYANWPVNENDLNARHVWLRERVESLRYKLEGDPDYFDTKIAGWWVWGAACWIGSGWCGDAGRGPWEVVVNDVGEKMFVKRDAGQGVTRQLPHLGNAGRGVINCNSLSEWFENLANRMRNIRVCCGDWKRVCGPSVTFKHGMTGVFLDPPYDLEMRSSGCYATDKLGIAKEVLEWGKENGSNPLLRIALCGYEGEHNVLEEEHGWKVVSWKASGGFGSQGKNTSAGRDNAHKERIWFSPACLTPESVNTSSKQSSIFDTIN